jgi:methionyl-tRNA synthetase
MGVWDMGVTPRDISAMMPNIRATWIAGADPVGDGLTSADDLRRLGFVVVQELFLALYRNGYVVPKTTMGAISPSTGRTLLSTASIDQSPPVAFRYPGNEETGADAWERMFEAKVPLSETVGFDLLGIDVDN